MITDLKSCGRVYVSVFEESLKEGAMFGQDKLEVNNNLSDRIIWIVTYHSKDLKFSWESLDHRFSGSNILKWKQLTSNNNQ